MFHVVVLVRFVFVPDEVSDEPAHYESVSADFFQEVALSLEHVFWVGGWALWWGHGGGSAFEGDA